MAIAIIMINMPPPTRNDGSPMPKKRNSGSPRNMLTTRTMATAVAVMRAVFLRAASV